MTYKIDCERTTALLSAYMDNELHRKAKSIVASHIASCPACARRLKLLTSLSAGMAAIQEQPLVGSNFRDKILTRLANYRNGEPERKEIATRLVPLLAAMAACLLFIGAGLLPYAPAASGPLLSLDDCEQQILQDSAPTHGSFSAQAF